MEYEYEKAIFSDEIKLNLDGLDRSIGDNLGKLGKLATNETMLVHHLWSELPSVLEESLQFSLLQAVWTHKYI